MGTNGIKKGKGRHKKAYDVKCGRGMERKLRELMEQGGGRREE